MGPSHFDIECKLKKEIMNYKSNTALNR